MTTLSPVERADLAATPVPTENGAPLASCVVAAPGGWQLAWMRDGGRHKEPFGRVYADPIEASTASRFRNEQTFGSWTT